MEGFVDWVNRAVWGAPLLVLILGTGVLVSLRTGFAQFRLFPGAWRLLARQLRDTEPASGVSPYRALCTALAATVGTGNLVGVAGAIALGGPGSIFWMWISGCLGMAVKYGEAALAVRYRVQEGEETLGGPMYMISRGLGKPRLAKLYCIFGILAAFGVGNAAQVNAIIGGIHQLAESIGAGIDGRGDLLCGVMIAALAGAVLLGGAGRIGRAAETLVPMAAVGYLLLCAGALIARWQLIGQAFSAILQGAFSPRALTGGMIGSGFRALRVGISRGIFTNEAGMGTASIAHGASEVRHPAEQGMMGILEVFLDTIVICTMTALVILTSGVAIPYGTEPGGSLTGAAFGAVYGTGVSAFLALALCAFAFATILGWSLYGGRCAQYLFGNRAWKWFALLQMGVAVLGAVTETGLVWALSEVFNGLMAVPNLFALVMLSPELRDITRDYKSKKQP